MENGMVRTIGTKPVRIKKYQCPGPGETSMKRCGFLFALLLTPCLLTACSYMERATLFNNTTDEITVALRGGRTVIAGSSHAEIHFVVTSELVARISSGECEYYYQVPMQPSSYRPSRKLDRGVQIQLEKDFSINLLPADYSGDAPASSGMVLQREGFPVQPVSRKCC